MARAHHEAAVGLYDMCEANTPGVGRVLAAHGLASIPEAHCYLRYGETRVDVTRAGVPVRAPIERFHAEWPLEPEEIGERKVRLHRDWLAQWLAGEGAPAGAAAEARAAGRGRGLSLEELWNVREACIRELGKG